MVELHQKNENMPMPFRGWMLRRHVTVLSNAVFDRTSTR